MVAATELQDFRTNQDQAIAHLTALSYQSGDRVFLRFFYPDGDPRKAKDKGIKLEATFPELPWKRIEQFQRDGRGCYFVVNGQGHQDSDVQAGYTFFYEHDDLDKALSRDLWRSLGLPEPTVQVDTGGKSIHSFWRLSSPCTVQHWRELQTDLLEYADGDRKLKNPSRVMRLAGAHHIKPGRSPICSLIIANGKTNYTYEELRDAVPRRQQPEHQLRWHEFEQAFRLPISDAVPLTVCLTRASRELIEQGAPEGERNDRGYALACDAIGVANHLNSLGQSFTDDPRNLFEQYCQRCTPPVDGGEVESIWKSATQRATSSSLSPEQIENCIKGWQWRQMDKSRPLPLATEPVSSKAPSSNIVEHPTANRVLSSAELQVRIGDLLRQNLNQSELEAIIPELARQAERQSKDVWALYRARLQEQEQEDSKQDRASELDKLLKIGSYRLTLHDYLDDCLAKPLEAIAGYMGTSPAAMLYTLLPVIASLCQVGTRLELIQATNFYALPILYTGLVAESGSGKSPVQKTILEPLFKLQREADENYEQDLAEHEREMAEWSRDKEGDKPIKPNPREYYTVDVTREAIAMIQSQQPNKGFLGWVDELSAIVSGRNQYRNGRGTDKEAMLSGRDGSPIKVNRASGKRISVAQSAYSLTGTTQPDTLKQLMGDFTDGAGEWARILWCLLPIQSAPFPDDAVSYDVSKMLSAVYQTIEALPATTYKLSPQALSLYRNWYNQLDNLRLGEPRQALRSVYQKMKGDTGVLMLLLHLTNSCAAGGIPALHIEAQTAKAAIALAKYSISQVKLIHSLGEEAQGELTPIMAKMVELSQRKGWLTARDAKQGINALRVGKQFTSDVIRRMFAELCEMGYGTLQGSGTRMQWIAQKTVEAVEEVLMLPSTAQTSTEQSFHTFVDDVDGEFASETTLIPLEEKTFSKEESDVEKSLASTSSTVNSNPSKNSAVSGFQVVDATINNPSTEEIEPSTVMPKGTSPATFQRHQQPSTPCSAPSKKAIPPRYSQGVAPHPHPPDWNPTVGEQVYVRQEEEWFSATIIAVPTTHSDPARSISCWKARLATGKEVIIWSLQDKLRPFSSNG